MPGVRTDYAVRRPVVNSYLVRQRDRRRLRELGTVLLVILPVGLGMIGNVWANHQLLKAGDRIQRLEQRLVELDRRRRQLQLEAEYLGSPTQIVKRARSELGMRYRTLDRTIFASEIE